jgi:Zn-finger protein
VSKICSKCKLSKNLDDFADCKKAADGKQWNCRDCKSLYKKQHKEHIAKQQKEYREINKDTIKEKNKIRYHNQAEILKIKNAEYRLNNKEYISQKAKERRQNNWEKVREIDKKSKLKNREKIIIKAKEYRIKNKEKIKEYRQRPEVIARIKANKIKNKDKINANKRYQEKLKRETNPSYKLITNQRTRITGILKKHKTTKTLDLLGCSAQFLRTYLESKFLDGMNWENYGKYGWHVDHIIPCSSFDLADSEQQKKCFHYTNLQPLWAIDNLKKSSKILTRA